MKKILILILISIQIYSYCQEIDHEFVFADTIQSEFFDKSQVIHIYLPPDYYHSNDNYPLQVVLGGHTRTRLYYSMNEYLSRPYQIEDLNHLHTIPESIVVGLSHTSHKYYDSFSKFVINEVIPHVESKYRKTHYKSLVGHSSDGGFVLYNLLKKESPFHSYFCTAPTKSNYFVNQLNDEKIVSELQKSNRKLFLGASQSDYFYDENIKLIEVFNKMDKGTFTFKSTVKNTDTHHSIFPVLIADALFFFYNDWHFRIPVTNPENTTESLIRHYELLSQKTGLELVPPEFDFYLLTYILDVRKHIDEKIKLLKKCKEFYPEAENADAYLGRTYYMTGDLQNAEIYNDYSLSLNPNNEFAKQTKFLIEKKKAITPHNN